MLKTLFMCATSLETDRAIKATTLSRPTGTWTATTSRMHPSSTSRTRWGSRACSSRRQTL